MTKPRLRPVKLWDAEIDWETRPDGAILVRQTAPLGDFPATMSERIEHWAEVRPETTWMAERAPGGGDWVLDLATALFPAWQRARTPVSR